MRLYGVRYDGVLKRHSANMLMFEVPGPFQSEGLEAYRKTWDLFFLPEPLDFRLTMGLRKIAGEWVIEHEHHSVPAP